MTPTTGRAATLFRDVQENIESYHFYADELLDDANTVLNVQLALAAHRTGEVMRILTVFSVFFLPLTFLVGVYGMNFDFMPELRSRWGYPAGAGGHGRSSCWPFTSGSAAAAGCGSDRRAGDARWPCRRRGGLDARPPAHGARAGRRRRPHLLPEPALEWLRRAYGALGVWVAELDPREEGPHAERIVDAERLSVAQIVAVDRRLERARDQEQSGAERMDSGTLVFHAAGRHGGGAAAAGRASTPPAARSGGGRPPPAARRRAPPAAGRGPGAGPDARRPRSSPPAASGFGWPTSSNACSTPRSSWPPPKLRPSSRARPALPALAQVRVVGVSGPRRPAPAGHRRCPRSATSARVARGEVGRLHDGGRSTGRRRRRSPPAARRGDAAADPGGRPGVRRRWRSGRRAGREPVGAALAELTEALANAGPRLARALEADQRSAARHLRPADRPGQPAEVR